MVHILTECSPQYLKKIMQGIEVDPYGVDIMLPKTITHLLKINSISNIAANILKQEMLSLGADVAVARDALTGRNRKTDCLIIGNLSQFNRLNIKLQKQPFGLGRLAREIASSLGNFQKENFTLHLGKYRLDLDKRVRIMGILNLTPDSFSGDGLYRISKIENIIRYAQSLTRDGADILDIGGESTRPGARPVPLKEELERTIPLIKLLAKKVKVPISIDTYKPEVARQALDNGADMVNDITGLKNPKMAKIIAQHKAAVVIMHMQGRPRTMQKNPIYALLIPEIILYLKKAIIRAEEAGIAPEKIIIDPGIGFGKTLAGNLEILKRLKDFKVLGKPILVGPSRKSFLGRILKIDPQKRIFGTVSACVLAAKGGAKIVRVHDIKPVYEALKVARAILNS